MLNSSEKVMWDLNRRRTWCLEKLRIGLSKIEKIAAQDLKKIEQHGAAYYYSQNHDILNCAYQVWTASLELGVLKAMEKEIGLAFEDLKFVQDEKEDSPASHCHIDPFELPNIDPTKVVPPPEEVDTIPEKETDNDNEK